MKASDKRLARLIDATEPVDSRAWRRAQPLGDPFSVLVYSIIGQQISGYAAQAIAGRLQERFGGRMPSPAELLNLDAADFRAIGFSGRKVEYVRSLAEHIISSELQIGHLDKLSDDEVREQITATRGLGRWTADMFLLINLDRPDIPSATSGSGPPSSDSTGLTICPRRMRSMPSGRNGGPIAAMASLYLWASTRAAPKPATARHRVAAR